MKWKMGWTMMGCLLLISACAGGGNNTGTSTGSPAPSAAPSAVASGSPSASAAPEKTLEVTMMRGESPSQPVKPDSVAIVEVKKRLNVKINMQSTPNTGYDDKKKTLIATNSMPDILLVDQDDVQNYADSGVFLDLTTYLDKGDMPNLAKYIEQQPEINKLKVDGKLYGFPFVDIPEYSKAGGQFSMIRTDILDELGLEKPTTFDELYAALKKMKEAYPKSFPYAARAANGANGTGNLLNAVAFQFGSGYSTWSGSKVYFEPTTQRYEFGPNSPAFKEAVTWLNKLYSEKILDPDYITADSQLWKQKLTSGQSFFYDDNNGFGVNFTIALQKDKPSAKFDMLPKLTAPNGTVRNPVFMIGQLTQSWVVRADVKEPERVVKFLDWFYSDEGTMLTNWGVEGEHYTIGPDGVPSFTDAFKDKYTKTAETANTAMWLSDLGALSAQLGLVSDDRNEMSLNGDVNPWNDIILDGMADGTNYPYVLDPPFNEEEREQLKQLRSQIDNYLEANMDKFIIKDGAIAAEWDSFVQALQDKGSDKLVKIFNDALARVK